MWEVIKKELSQAKRKYVSRIEHVHSQVCCFQQLYSLDFSVSVMFYLSFHSSISFPSYLLSTLIGHSNLIRSSTICFMILAQFVPYSLSSSDDRALTIVRSIDEYLCKNYLLTCFFRQRYHESFDDDNQKPTSLDLCKSLLILHSCLHHDTDTMRICSSTTVNRAKLNLNLETPKHCFTSSVYKTFFAQHLRSLALSSTALEWPIVVLFLLLISFVIRIRACYWHCIAGNWPGMCHRFIRNLLFFARNRERKETASENLIFSGDRHMHASGILFSLEHGSQGTALPAERQDRQHPENWLLMRFVHVLPCSVRWSSYNNSAAGLGRDCVKQPFLFFILLFPLPLMHILRRLGSSLTRRTKFSGDISSMNIFSSFYASNGMISDWIRVYFHIRSARRKHVKSSSHARE